ncbi:hypothetical protein [Helicobacter suis]|uniref:Peptidoglycan synthesis protein n=5 Tax=Helicobacter suis TaxID=104628 RepID=E7G352_9HELI|nr:hypothetical protein [Helicobacter suis]EFX42199.1 peptidoglycan synthesis protein [Helicobacter suis HS5]EFX43317.1 putative ligase [Helicobacter suis HS1]BCD45630.1 ferrochelatase [Helicobacter suis]BCD47329.1 ferrochelatase [Helicobacter suis]BCD49083.1 ferrochelatase [Helicobacter suis]
MNVDEVLSITRGTLQSNPVVHTFSHITHTIERVKKGALFIALEPSYLDLAIKLGAYGVLTNQKNPSDLEIAWIYVQNLQDALNRLLYYKFMDSQIPIITLSRIECLLLSRLVPSGLYFFKGEIVDLLDLDLTTISALIMQESFLANSLKLVDTLPYQILQEQLLASTILYKNRRYHLKLAGLYLPELAKVLQVCQALNIPVELNRLGAFPKPFYTNKRLEPCAQYSQILFLEKHKEMINLAIYAQRKAPWLKQIIFTQEELDMPHILYKTLHELKTLLTSQIYHLAFIIGEVEITDLLYKPYKKSLFDAL